VMFTRAMRIAYTPTWDRGTFRTIHLAPPRARLHPPGIGGLHPSAPRPCGRQSAQNNARVRSAVGMAELWDIGERDSRRSVTADAAGGLGRPGTRMS